MLAQKINGQWQTWGGEAISDIRYPLNVEQLWTDEDLAAVGLYRITDAAIPDGKIAAEWPLQDVDGKPVNTPTLINAPIPQKPTKADLLAQISALQEQVNALPD